MSGKPVLQKKVYSIWGDAETIGRLKQGLKKVEEELKPKGLIFRTKADLIVWLIEFYFAKSSVTEVKREEKREEANVESGLTVEDLMLMIPKKFHRQISTIDLGDEIAVSGIFKDKKEWLNFHKFMMYNIGCRYEHRTWYVPKNEEDREFLRQEAYESAKLAKESRREEEESGEYIWVYDGREYKKVRRDQKKSFW